MNIPELLQLPELEQDLDRVESALRASVTSEDAFLGEVASHLISAGGKRLRPMLTVAALLAATIGRLCEGQVAEVRSTFDPTRSEAAYFPAIGGKTAALTSSACRIGALTTGLDRPLVDALTRFGYAFGMAFQIRDDL